MPNWFSNTALADDWLGAISASPLLPEERPILLARLVMVSFGITLFALIVWAGLVPLKEVTAAYGQVLPSGEVQVVQHLEGGIIKKILVRDGDLVAAGQPLLVLQSAEATGNLNKAVHQRRALELEAESHKALIAGRAPAFAKIAADDSDLVIRQRDAFANMKAARQQERSVIAAQIAQFENALRGLEAKRAVLDGNVKINEEEFAMAKKLFDQGYYSKIRFFEKQKELNALRGEQQMARLDIERTKNEIGEYASRLQTLASTQIEQSHQELARVHQELARIDEEMAKHNDRVRRLEVLAPVNGIVKGIEVHTVSGVVAPGQRLMEIVPLGRALKVEASIRPTDIGQIRLGQPVKVKVHAFDYTHFGTLEGELESVSATTFVGPNNTTYYKGIVRLYQQHVGDNPKKNILVPGMTVDADIITGERTLLAYLLKPIRNAADTAFTEK